MAPFDLITVFGKTGSYAVYFLIGIAFGYVLEMAGFGDSRKLSAQFYLKEMRVIKVMFTGVVVASVLIFMSSALGLLNLSGVWVHPTYLTQVIIAGLIMGFGFIIGGFCPGTSLVAASTFKIDGIIFVLGVVFGAGIFGETVGLFDSFWNSNMQERFVLPDILGVSTGWAVFLICLVAVVVFYWSEISEKIFGEGKSWQEISLLPQNKGNIAAATTLLFFAIIVVSIGQPDSQEKWSRIQAEAKPLLDKRSVYIDPRELQDLMYERTLYLKILDFRSEKEFNLFHLRDSSLSKLQQLQSKQFIKSLQEKPDTVIVALSTEEVIATQAWKTMKALGLVNIYILEGGINNWLKMFPPPETIAYRESGQFIFIRSVGERIGSAFPVKQHGGDAHDKETHGEQPEKLPYTKKVKMQKKKAVMGGCG